MSIPDAITRRDMVYGQPKKPVDYVALGKAYFEAGRPTDALDCALRIEGDTEGHDALVAAVRDAAIGRGDFFVLNRVHGVSELSEAQWKKAYEVARSSGKTRYALKFAKHLGDTAEVERLELELGIRLPEAEEGDGEPKAEEKPKAEDAEAEDAKADDAEAEDAKADDAKDA